MASETAEIPLGTIDFLPHVPGQPELPHQHVDISPGETVIGCENPAYEHVEEKKLDDVDTIDGELPPLTYVDFMPRCLGTIYVKGKIPEFSEFGVVVEQANQWLQSMPQYVVQKCETISKKLSGNEYQIDNDAVFAHISSHGSNVYLMGIRLWLVPNDDSSRPVQKIGYMTVLPDHDSGLSDSVVMLITQQTGFQLNAVNLFQQFSTLTPTMTKLNRQFQLNPIGGKILNVETLKLILTEDNPKSNPEITCRVETGRTNRLFVYAQRIFYVVGEPAFETLAIHDVVPDYVRSVEGINHRVKFSTYRSTVQKASDWLAKQQGIQVLNVQTVDIKVYRHPNGILDFSSETSGHGEMAYEECCQFVKVLRIFHVKKQGKDSSMEAIPRALTSRLFVPVRKNQTGKVFESFSKTIQRVISWLNVTKIPVLSVESVLYQVTPESWGSGVSEDKVEVSHQQGTGRYLLTCIRVYFPQEFEEPSPDLLPPTKEDEEGWGCVIS